MALWPIWHDFLTIKTTGLFASWVSNIVHLHVIMVWMYRTIFGDLAPPTGRGQ